ncbi:MAG: hypothetical protein LBH44_05315 [Treponema sp.]|jgi:hypothetical protein|nr:hypothetical protein [Treponema sp.]
MKRTVLIVLALALASLFLTGCFTGWTGDEGSITINIGGENGRAASWPPTKDNGLLPLLEHEITIEGPAGQKDFRKLEAGKTSTTFPSVAPGKWKVTVKATCMDMEFGSGNGSGDVKAGKSTPVSVDMKKSDTTFFVVANYEDWGSAWDAINDQMKPDSPTAGSNDGGKYCIILTNTAPFSIYNPISPESKIDLTLIGKDKTRIIEFKGTGSLFTVYENASLTLEKNIALKGNSTNNAALVTVYGGKFTMNGNSSITGNTNYPGSGGGSGGGVLVYEGTFTMNGGTISGNNAKGSPSFGGGVSVDNYGTFNMTGGTIGGTGTATNTAGSGGGVFVDGGEFNMSGTAKVIGNKAEEGGGGGVSVINDGSFTMTGGTISRNTAIGQLDGAGGGVYVYVGTFTLNGGTISDNTATVSADGVYFDDGIFTMTSGTISSSSNAPLGGVVLSTGTFNMSGNASISGFTVSGVRVGGTFNMSGSASIFGNTGFGVELNSYEATFKMNDSASISGNGGGVYVNGLDATFTMSGGTITGNGAAQQGGGVCVGNNSYFYLINGIIAGASDYNYGGTKYAKNTATDGISAALFVDDSNGGVAKYGNPNVNPPIQWTNIPITAMSNARNTTIHVVNGKLQ